MKTKIQICKNCNKEYKAKNGNQLYCCDVCRQQAYYKRHGIDRSFRPIYGNNVNQGFTPVVDTSKKIEINEIKKESEPIQPAPVTPVPALINSNSKSINSDNFHAILEQMNKTHQAQMEAMEIRLKLSFEQDKHEREKQAKEKVISELNEKIDEMNNKSNIDTNQVILGLTSILNGMDIKEFLKK